MLLKKTPLGIHYDTTGLCASNRVCAPTCSIALQKTERESPVIHPDGTCVRKAGVVYCSGMSKKQKKPPKREQTEKEPRRKTPTFLLELPLEVNAGQAKRILGHLEAGRQFYNAVLSEG